MNAKPGADVLEIVDGLVVDIDEEGQPVGIDMQHASRHLDVNSPSPSARGDSHLVEEVWASLRD